MAKTKRKVAPEDCPPGHKMVGGKCIKQATTPTAPQERPTPKREHKHRFHLLVSDERHGGTWLIIGRTVSLHHPTRYTWPLVYNWDGKYEQFFHLPCALRGVLPSSQSFLQQILLTSRTPTRYGVAFGDLPYHIPTPAIDTENDYTVIDEVICVPKDVTTFPKDRGVNLGLVVIGDECD
jgi:hypothetical protein